MKTISGNTNKSDFLELLLYLDLGSGSAPWLIPRPPTKFCRKLFGGFCIILQILKPIGGTGNLSSGDNN